MESNLQLVFQLQCFWTHSNSLTISELWDSSQMLWEKLPTRVDHSKSGNEVKRLFPFLFEAITKQCT
jgi:hypothetical protein